MFKLEVEVNGETFGHYWMNKHEDDFLQFIPSQFTTEYGELITKDNITAYKIDENFKALFEGKLNQNSFNKVDCDSGGAGKLRICRHDKSRFNVGTFLSLDIFEEEKARREAIFSDSAVPQIVTSPDVIQYDFGDGVKDAIQLDSNNELVSDYSSVELELEGATLVKWPYDEEGKFLGNE